MITDDLVKEAIEMTAQGASTKDLYTRLFVPKEEFITWFAHGYELVEQGYGRYTRPFLEFNEDVDEFDILCLDLYKGIVTQRWEIKKEIHELVAKSESPNVAFKYLEAVYRTEFNPKFVEEDETSQEDKDAESSTSYVMESFFEKQPDDDAERKKDALFPDESEDVLLEEEDADSDTSKG